MPRTFRDTLAYVAANVVCDTNRFAETLTLYHYSATALTTNQMLSLMGYPPLPDGDIDAADRRQLLGLYRFGDLGTNSEEVDGVFREDSLEAFQGFNTNDDTGRRITEYATLRIPATVSIVCDETPEKCDYVIRDGARWSCLRVVSRSSSMQTVALRRDSKVTTKSARPQS